MKHDLKDAVVCAVSLGYVGLPLARTFARSLKVIGLDTNIELVRELNLCSNSQNLVVTDNSQQMKQTDFIIITPTPVTKPKEPDLSHSESISKIISQNYEGRLSADH